MMFHQKLVCLCLVSGLSLPALTYAENTAFERSSSLSMPALVNMVYEQYLPKQREQAQKQKIDANTAIANAVFADTASINLEHYNDAIGSSDGFQEWQGSVDFPLWLEGQKESHTVFSGKLTAELPAYQQQLKLQASGLVRDAIWQVVLAEMALLQVNQQLQASKRLEQDVQDRIQAGDLAATEALLVQAHNMETQRQVLEKTSQFDYAKQHYSRLTAQSALPIEYEEILATQQQIDRSHPSLALQMQKMETLRAQQSLAKYENAVNSTVSVGVRRERDAYSESFNHSIGLGLVCL